MNNIDLRVCRLQGEIFEESLNVIECGSASFIRNFMHSDIASHIDGGNIMSETISINQIFNEYIKQYGNRKYGKRKYGAKSLYWVGYIYRYWCQKENRSSKSVYRAINGNELNSLYAPYHTMSPDNVIRRIEEAKDEVRDDEYLKRVMRKIFL